MSSFKNFQTLQENDIPTRKISKVYLMKSSILRHRFWLKIKRSKIKESP